MYHLETLIQAKHEQLCCLVQHFERLATFYGVL